MDSIAFDQSEQHQWRARIPHTLVDNHTALLAAWAGVRPRISSSRCATISPRSGSDDRILPPARPRGGREESCRRGGAAPPGDLTSFPPEGDQVPLLRFLTLLTRGRPQAGPVCDPSVPTEADASFFTLSKRKGLPHLSVSRPRDRGFHVESVLFARIPIFDHHFDVLRHDGVKNLRVICRAAGENLHRLNLWMCIT